MKNPLIQKEINRLNDLLSQKEEQLQQTKEKLKRCEEEVIEKQLELLNGYYAYIFTNPSHDEIMDRMEKDRKHLQQLLSQLKDNGR